MTNEQIAWVVLIALAYWILTRRRSRHIPSRSKRWARNRFEREWLEDPANEGKPFPGFKGMEYDHVHPWTKGGTHDPENIRLITREENRSKGAKTNRWELIILAALILLMILWQRR